MTEFWSQSQPRSQDKQAYGQRERGWSRRSLAESWKDLALKIDQIAGNQRDQQNVRVQRFFSGIGDQLNE